LPTFEPLPRPYELMVLISPEVTDEALTAEVDGISALIAQHGGEVTHVKRDTPWGRRRLAYPINKFRDATYVLYHFNCAPSRIIEIERDLKLNERVIRYLLIRQEGAPAAPEAPAESEAVEAAE
jgi:ribosomal protein S6